LAAPSTLPLADPWRALALPLSVALHIGLLLAASLMNWPASELRARPAATVVWLGDWRVVRPEAAAVTEPVEEASRPPPREDLAVTGPLEQAGHEPIERLIDDLEAAPPLVAERDTRPEPPAVSDEFTIIENVQEPEPRTVATAPAAGSDSTESDLPSEIDWEAAKRQAIANVVEQLEREAAYTRFSSDDLDAEVPLEESLAEGRIFDTPTRSGPSLLAPGKSSTKFGRWFSELCNTLTGGFGLFGASVCADNEAQSDLFAVIKPEYLKKRPVCADPGLTDPVLAAASREQGISTIKCRLVYADEYYELIGLSPIAPEAQARQ